MQKIDPFIAIPEPVRLAEDFDISKYGISARLVRESDASFIHGLRTNATLGQFLSSTPHEVEDQVAWITAYRERERVGAEYYFLIYDSLKKTPLGLYRLYRFQSDRFEVGSWLFSPGLGSIPILGDLIVRGIGFHHFGYALCNFEVRKGNTSVLSYHKRLFSSELVSEDDQNYYFTLSKTKFEIAKKRLERSFTIL